MSKFTEDLQKHKDLIKNILYNFSFKLKERADNHDNSKYSNEEKDVF